MKIFVTGANGFLGKHLCDSLVAAGHELTRPSSKECDLCDPSALRAYANQKFDQIFHLAAWTQAGDFCLRHPGEQWIVNQKMNTNMLDWWHEAQPQAKMIAIGTSCCYEPGTPHVEERFLIGEPTPSLFTYAMTKRMLYSGLLALNQQYGYRYLFLIPSTLYGPEYHLDARQMHFIFDLMRKIVEGKEDGSPVVLWGDGMQSRELIQVRDFVRVALSLSETLDNDIVNIGGGAEYPIRHFAELLSEIVGYDPALIQYDTSKYVGAKSKSLVIDKLKAICPEFSPMDLREGLTEITEWYRTERKHRHG